MQMYLWNSSTQGITTDAPSSTLIEKVEMDNNGMRSVIMRYKFRIRNMRRDM